MLKDIAKSVLVVSGNKKSADALTGVLDTALYYPISVAHTAGEGRQRALYEGFDIIIINSPLDDEPGYELALDVADSTNSGVLLLVRHEVYDQTRYRVESSGVFTLAKPFSQELLEIALNMVCAARTRLARLENENLRLTKKIEEIRIVSRTKWRLIELRGITEAEAHRQIEKRAMDSRRTRSEVCAEILRELE